MVTRIFFEKSLNEATFYIKNKLLSDKFLLTLVLSLTKVRQKQKKLYLLVFNLFFLTKTVSQNFRILKATYSKT